MKTSKTKEEGRDLMLKKVVLSLRIVFLSAAILLAMGKNQASFGFAFSLDIGSDSELSDPNNDGDEGFDPGDAYRSDAPGGSIVLPSGEGADGTHRDDEELLGSDPIPDAGSSSPGEVPVGTCPRPGRPTCYRDYFDLDGYDVVNLQITALREAGYRPPYLKDDLEADYGEWGWLNCIHEVRYLAVSFDDDAARGWAPAVSSRVPVESPSPLGKTYGGSAEMDEIVGINLVTGTAAPYELDKVFGIANETDVHIDLMPNPDSDESEDDDVDALDMLYAEPECDVFLYSADSEAKQGPGGSILLPGAIYQEGLIDPIIRPWRHLGLTREVDIDAFEMAWLATETGDLALGLVFSVDEDDPRTGYRDETGGLDPSAIYASFLNRSYYEIVSPFLSQQMYSIHTSDGLLSIDVRTGTATVIGYAGGGAFALDFDPDGRLFHVYDDNLIEIDINNPAASTKTALSIDNFYPHAAAFRSDGGLFAVQSYGSSGDSLYFIDTNSGDVSWIGDITGSGVIDGMDFDPDDRLWAVDSYRDELLELDPATAAVLNRYAISWPAGYNTDDFGMAIDESGRMYVTNEYLLEITDYLTGTPTGVVIGPTGYTTLHCLAIRSERFDDIDAITISETDLFIEELNQPIIYQKQ
jgi:hypothetical protein